MATRAQLYVGTTNRRPDAGVDRDDAVLRRRQRFHEAACGAGAATNDESDVGEVLVVGVEDVDTTIRNPDAASVPTMRRGRRVGEHDARGEDEALAADAPVDEHAAARDRRRRRNHDAAVVAGAPPPTPAAKTKRSGRTRRSWTR